MKRELKFRALFTHIVKNESIWLNSTVNHTIKDLHGYIQKSEWLEFTGLTDKNGKEIYEKDWIAVNGLILGYIIFDNGCFQIYDKNSTQGTNPINKDRIKNIEIIGNIYENPEILSEYEKP